MTPDNGNGIPFQKTFRWLFALSLSPLPVRR
ncbi:hypothetical protein SEA_FANCYPANTS_54 [Mycobacterium phage Fancypants]|uniref:Uncharacterized protein n=1 Tax=Mycobacterium phage Fancypants TaxID=2530128 RepID=A0A481VUT9_9CAUD|nr:hypothetical protein I5H36_gp054 [Mycobacterium phage Fancypants]QBI97448.1 hypothetical protein SEA_FANCYPANTS_54 [Mycobacterium phage Fancypants]